MSNALNWNNLRQLSFPQIVLSFLLPSAFAFTGFRVILPALENTGHPKLLMWPVIASVMSLVFVIIGLKLIHSEAKTLNVSLAERLLRKKISGKQWLICLGIMIVGIELSTAVAPLVQSFSQIPGLSIPDYMPF